MLIVAKFVFRMFLRVFLIHISSNDVKTLFFWVTFRLPSVCLEWFSRISNLYYLVRRIFFFLLPLVMLVSKFLFPLYIQV